MQATMLLTTRASVTAPSMAMVARRV